jgi:hypothetical protein
LLDEAAAKVRLAAAAGPPQQQQQQQQQRSAASRGSAAAPATSDAASSSSSSSGSSSFLSSFFGDTTVNTSSSSTNQNTGSTARETSAASSAQQQQASSNPFELSGFAAEVDQAMDGTSVAASAASQPQQPQPAAPFNSNIRPIPHQHQQQPQQLQQQQQQAPILNSMLSSAVPKTAAAAAAAEGSVAAAVGPQRWSDWVTARGWRGEAEVHRQQLLEWFGASPAQPLKGVAGARVQSVVWHAACGHDAFVPQHVAARLEFKASPAAAAGVVWCVTRTATQGRCRLAHQAGAWPVNLLYLMRIRCIAKFLHLVELPDEPCFEYIE